MPVIPRRQRQEDLKFEVSPDKVRKTLFRQNTNKRAGEVAQVAECLSSMH
jgi:hypothetical protein